MRLFLRFTAEIGFLSKTNPHKNIFGKNFIFIKLKPREQSLQYYDQILTNSLQMFQKLIEPVQTSQIKIPGNIFQSFCNHNKFWTEHSNVLNQVLLTFIHKTTISKNVSSLYFSTLIFGHQLKTFRFDPSASFKFWVAHKTKGFVFLNLGES